MVQQYKEARAKSNQSFYRKFGKRLLDLSVSSLVLLVALPVIGICALAVRLSMGAPVFFKQRRVGLGEETFTILKLRTMSNAKDKNGNLLPDAERKTLVGSIIRRLSLDELPQLLNVLKGDMSLVGPRPLLEKYLPYYTDREKLRHTVPPGITGYAQVNGRNATTWDRRLSLDAEYAESYDLAMDMKILLLTAKKVVKSDSIESGATTTMPYLSDERSKAA